MLILCFGGGSYLGVTFRGAFLGCVDWEQKTSWDGTQRLALRLANGLRLLPFEKELQLQGLLFLLRRPIPADLIVAFKAFPSLQGMARPQRKRLEKRPFQWILKTISSLRLPLLPYIHFFICTLPCIVLVDPLGSLFPSFFHVEPYTIAKLWVSPQPLVNFQSTRSRNCKSRRGPWTWKEHKMPILSLNLRDFSFCSHESEHNPFNLLYKRWILV